MLNDRIQYPSAVVSDRPLVLYHSGCPDGWCSAWLMWRTFGDGADYVACKYGDRWPESAIGRQHVFLVDFSWPAEELLDLAIGCGGRLTVLDHHESAKDALVGFVDRCKIAMTPDLPIVVFDQSHSGAHLTWQHLKDIGADDSAFVDGNPPLIVSYVEDRDLWSWRLPDSREVSAAINSYPRKFDVWNQLHELLATAGGDGYWRLVREGSALLRVVDLEVEKACSAAVEITIAGHKVLAVNTSNHHSEIGGRLAEGRAFGSTFYDDLKRGLRVWSFRSRDGGVDVSEIARRLGGGGHRNASGAQRPLDEPISELT